MFSVDRQSFQSLSALALFTFAFLGSEFFFDSRIGLFISAEGVVSAQAMILGASVVGFLAYAPISKLAGGRRELRAAEAVGAIAALVTIAVAESALAMQITGCIAFFLLGNLGAEAHWGMAHAFEGSRRLPKEQAQLTPPHPATVPEQPVRTCRHGGRSGAVRRRRRTRRVCGSWRTRWRIRRSKE